MPFPLKEAHLFPLSLETPKGSSLPRGRGFHLPPPLLFFYMREGKRPSFFLERKESRRTEGEMFWLHGGSFPPSGFPSRRWPDSLEGSEGR